MPARLESTSEEMAAYRDTLRRRGEAERLETSMRRKHAWETAQRAAAFLQESFSASRVFAFGSLARGYWFTRTSDIDLAAWGIKSEDYFLAVARLQDLSPEFKIDLVRMEDCKPALREAILKAGKPL